VRTQDGTLQDVCDAVLAQPALRLPAVAVLRIILQLAEGLCAMHAHSPPFAHRDVKPANVLLAGGLLGLLRAAPPAGAAPPAAWGQKALLTDFGSARPARAAADAAAAGGAAARAAARAAVEAAAVECSAPYRPPELFDCTDATVIDARVDVWALGCTLCAPAGAAWDRTAPRLRRLSGAL
jgi:serine/threonine kinase 16